MGQSSLKEIGKLFLKLGLIAFGGPAAHIAMMRDEVVFKKKWMTENDFLDLVGATHLIPGPNSTELAIHIGKEKGGWRGLLLSGLSFIVPAVLITLAIAWFYKEYGSLPKVNAFFYGIKPAIIPIILSAVYPMAKSALKSKFLIGLAILALILSLFHVAEIIILFGSGFLALLLKWSKNGQETINNFNPLFLLGISNSKLFWTFFKIGSILYGSGYVLFAFLDSELVETGILPRETLVDAIAIGQFTPGPVFSSVTFIGYQISGLQGAFIATLAIFIPSFLFVALLNPIVKKLRKSDLFSSFLDAVNVASVALIGSVCLTMGKEILLDWKTILIFCTALVITFGCKKINSVYILLGGSVLGYLLSLLG